VYHTPLVVQPQFEFRPTPDNYRRTYQGPGQLPDRIKVWRVQNSPRGNMVSPSCGFLDSPDAEIIVVGFNLAKEYGAIGIGRQANFLQWGYGDPPSQMTEAGRRLFINCIHYIHRFDGKVPLVRRCAAARDSAVYVASILARIDTMMRERTLIVATGHGSARDFPGGPTRSSPPGQIRISEGGVRPSCIVTVDPDSWLPLAEPPVIIQAPSSIPTCVSPERKESFLKTFAPELYDRYGADSNGLVTYYRANLELVYWDGVFRVDDDLKSLGIESNRKVETLERLFELRQDPVHRDIAQRVLDRYTDGYTTFDFRNGRDRIYFSDVGGYKFSVVPEGYLTVQNSGAGTSETPSR
jgi:hypothetical protein